MAYIGQRRTIGGQEYEYTETGWQPVGGNLPGPPPPPPPPPGEPQYKVGEIVTQYPDGTALIFTGRYDAYGDPILELRDIGVSGGGGSTAAAPTTYGATKIIDLPGGYKAIQQDTNYGPQIVQVIPPPSYLGGSIPPGYKPVYDQNGNIVDLKPDPNYVGVTEKLTERGNILTARGQDVTARGNVLSALVAQGNLASQLDPFGQATVLMGGGRGGTTPFEEWARMFYRAIQEAQGQLNPILPYEPLFPTASAEGGYYGDPRNQAIRVHDGETVVTDRGGRLVAIIPKEESVRPTMSAKQGFTANDILQSQQSGLAEQTGTPGTQNDIATPAPGTVVTKEAQTQATGGILTLPDGTTYSPTGTQPTTTATARPASPSFEILPSSYSAADRNEILSAGLDPASPTALTDLRLQGGGAVGAELTYGSSPTSESVFQNQGELYADTDTNAVYILIGNQLHWIPNPETFNALGLDWGAIKKMKGTQGIFADQNITMGAPVNIGPTAGQPQLFVEKGDPTVYLLDENGVLHHLTDRQTFEGAGLNWGAIRRVPKGFLKHFTMGEKWKISDIQGYQERAKKGLGSEKEIDYLREVLTILQQPSEKGAETAKLRAAIAKLDAGIQSGVIRGNETTTAGNLLKNLLSTGKANYAKGLLLTLLTQGFGAVGATPDETQLDILKDILKDFPVKEWAKTKEGSGDVPTFQDEILGTGGTIIPGTGVTLPPLSQLSVLWPTLDVAQKEALASAYLRYGGIGPEVLQEYIQRYTLSGARAPQIIGYG